MSTRDSLREELAKKKREVPHGFLVPDNILCHHWAVKISISAKHNFPQLIDIGDVPLCIPHNVIFSVPEYTYLTSHRLRSLYFGDLFCHSIFRFI